MDPASVKSMAFRASESLVRETSSIAATTSLHLLQLRDNISFLPAVTSICFFTNYNLRTCNTTIELATSAIKTIIFFSDSYLPQADVARERHST